MNTIKAISIGTLSSEALKKIECIINEKKYSASSSFGFEIISSSLSHIESRFIERIVSERIYETLEGVEEKIEYVDYYRITFILRADSIFSLCLIDPPRNTKYGLQMIRSMLASDAKLKSIEFDLSKLLELAHKDEKIKITSASMSNLKVHDEILAKLKLISNHNISEFVREKYQINSGCIDSLSGELNGVPMEISKLGRIKVSSDHADHTLSMLEKLNILLN